jgi:hypothetical protein
MSHHCRIQRIKVAAAAAQWASQQLAEQGLLLPVDGVTDAKGAVLPAQGMWLRSMLLLARTLHAAEATVGATIASHVCCLQSMLCGGVQLLVVLW